MKVFVSSDIHGRFEVLNKIVDFIKGREDIDLIILCGDITGDHLFRYFFELEDQQYEDYKKLKEMLSGLNRKVLFIQGNHDVFYVDKSDTTYLPYNSAEAFKNFISIEYLNFSMYGTKREGNEEDMHYLQYTFKYNPFFKSPTFLSLLSPSFRKFLFTIS